MKTDETSATGALARRMHALKTPGMSIAVIDRGQLAWAKGYGVRDAHAGDPVTPDTLFQAASISKPVAAVGVLRLALAGKLHLDRPANDQLSSWKIPDNDLTRQAPVTPRMLLAHTAGTTVHGFPGYPAGASLPTLCDVLDGRGSANSPPVRVDLPPGSTTRYSGGGYCVCQQLVADVAQRPFDEHMTDDVLAPLAMSRSTFAQPLPPELAAGDVASAHDDEASVVPGKWHTYPEQAAAGLWTTPSDLARFAIALMDAYNGEPGSVLSADLAAQMLTPNPDGVGLGIFVGGHGPALRFSHDGANARFRARPVAYPATGQGAVVMVNSENATLLGEITHMIAQKYAWPSFATAPAGAASPTSHATP